MSHVKQLKLSGSAEDLKTLEILLKSVIGVKSLEVTEEKQKVLKDYNTMSCCTFSYDQDEVYNRFKRSYDNVGRKKKELTWNDLDKIRYDMIHSSKTADDLAKEYGISRRTLFRRLEEDNKELEEDQERQQFQENNIKRFKKLKSQE